MDVMWSLSIQRKKKLQMRKPISQMSAVEYEKHMRSLENKVLFWGLMYDLHPIPLILLILIAWGVGSCLGW